MVSKKSSKREINVGDFVAGRRWSNREISIGIVYRIEGELGFALDPLDESYLLNGFMHYVKYALGQHFDLDEISMKRVTKNTALKKLDIHSNFLDEKVKAGGLLGGLSVIRRHNLGILADRIRSSKDHAGACMARFLSPETGNYVIVPTLRREDDNEMEFLVVEPRRPVKIIEKLMDVLFPVGTENIHGDKYLMYRAYELPEEGLHLVQHPLRLKLDIGYEVTF